VIALFSSAPRLANTGHVMSARCRHVAVDLSLYSSITKTSFRLISKQVNSA